MLAISLKKKERVQGQGPGFCRGGSGKEEDSEGHDKNDEELINGIRTWRLI